MIEISSSNLERDLNYQSEKDPNKITKNNWSCNAKFVGLLKYHDRCYKNQWVRIWIWCLDMCFITQTDLTLN